MGYLKAKTCKEETQKPWYVAHLSNVGKPELSKMQLWGTSNSDCYITDTYAKILWALLKLA
jgi:hypothetical protein